MRHIIIHKTALVLIPVLGLAGFLLLTSPQTLPLPMLFVPFILLFFTIFYFLSLLTYLVAPNFMGKRVIIASVGAALPTILLVLQSIGQSSLPDLLIVFTLMIVFIFYLSKADFIK